MKKLLSEETSYSEVLVAANEEFPSAPAAATPENDEIEVRGWSAYEIWYSRIRLRPE